MNFMTHFIILVSFLKHLSDVIHLFLSQLALGIYKEDQISHSINNISDYNYGAFILEKKNPHRMPSAILSASL